MRSRLFFPALGAGVVMAAVGALWWTSRPPPAPPPVPDQPDQRYEDIDREKYEAWMQELGYTE